MYESFVEKQIRLAQERGDFDDLPGKGKPLPQLEGPADELWWVRRYLEREGLSTEALLPPSVQLRKELDRLDETMRGLPDEAAVRAAVRELNLRIVEYLRYPTGPRAPVGKIDADAAVRRWRAHRTPTPVPPPVSPTPAAAPRPARRRRWWRRRP